ncbi:RelE/StbE family addiction module toxin, partial [Campylobacter fetus subsp. testudinum]|uniref:type II toxin-antitoxin system mRNA interferase toxin, RelE/StbE family n=1 Tax=Campylobacter fetus TaxID=196 RepID=UPI000828133C
MEKYKLQYSKSFVKDYKKLSNQNKDLVDEILDRLLNREILESKYKDHELKGSLK